METMTLKAKVRTESGTRAARRVRQEGSLPAIIYGHGEPPESIVMSHHDVEVALAHGLRMLSVELQGKTKLYLIKDVQYDHLGATPIHMDLNRVDLDERVTVRVGIELRGIPKGASEGGILEQLMPDLEVECLVTDIPDTLHPIVTELEIGDSLFVKDLDLPRGVKALADPEERMAMVRAAVAKEEEEEEEVGEAEGDTEEPERIGRVRKEDEAADKGGS